MRAPLVCFALALLLDACQHGGDLTSPVANPVDNVLITVMVPGQCLNLGCDPPSADRTTLALVRVRNTGSVTSYLQTCGQQSALAEQQFVNGQWQDVGPAITCPVGAGPIALSPGDSIRVNWFFATGRRRIVLGVAGSVDLSNEGLSTSAAVDIP